MFDTKGVDLRKRLAVAKANDRTEAAEYLEKIISLEENAPEHNHDQIQDCYDKLNALYSSDDPESFAWRTMDIGIKYLRYKG